MNFGLYIYLSFLLLEIGLASFIGVARSIKESFFIDSKSLFCVTFKYLYYFTYCFGTVGYIVITLVNLSFLLDVEKLKISIDEVIAIFVLVAPFILFQISFRKIHRLFLSKKQSNPEMNN